MIRSKWIIVACLSLAVLALCGCGEVPEDPPKVQRLIREQFARFDQIAVPPPAIPADAKWQVRGTQAIENTPTGLRLDARTNPAVLSLPLDLNAYHHSEFRVRMRVALSSEAVRAGGGAANPRASFSWRSAIEPQRGPAVEITVPIFPDDLFHTYRFPLRREFGSHWVGNIKQMILVPVNVPAQIEIEQMEIAYDPPAGPLHITLAGETHEAVFGTQPPWTVIVPENAMFETYLGIAESAWEDSRSDGVVFLVSLTNAESQREVLAEIEMNPAANEDDRRWKRAQYDLGAYAGQTVTFQLSVLQRENPVGDHAYWGGPMVYASEADPASIPVILISNDTLRADHMSAYGYARKTTPYLDEFRKDAVLFENAMCHESWTLSSHMTMMTGLSPKNHRVSLSMNLPASIPTLAEELSESSYLTAGFTGFEILLRARFGFARGFDVYNTPGETIGTPVRNIEATFALARDWLAGHDADPFFLFLHNYDIHGLFPGNEYGSKLPYFPAGEGHLHFSRDMKRPALFMFNDSDGPTNSEILDQIISRGERLTYEENAYVQALYDDGIRYVDRNVRGMLESLKQMGIYDGALIIVTADHGEEFQEHGWFHHGQMYEETQRVPLLIKFPDNEFAGETVPAVVQLADLFPTIMDVVGLPAPPNTDGQSLYALVRGDLEPTEEAYGQRLHQRVLRTKEWRIVLNSDTNETELYNLALHPGEQVNLAEAKPEVHDSMLADLHDYFPISREGWNFVFAAPRTIPYIRMTAIADRPLQGADWVLHEISPNNRDTYTFSEDRHMLEAYVKLDVNDRDEIIVRPTAGGERLNLTVSSEVPFFVAVGQDPPVAGTVFRIVLEPSEREYLKPEALLEAPATRPLLAIWYEPPEVTGEAAEALSGEEREQLEALGYLGN